MRPFPYRPLRLSLLLWLMLGGNFIVVTTAARAQDPTRNDKLYQEGKELETKGDYPGALAKYEAGLAAAERQRDRRRIARTLNKMGNVYLKQGDYPPAAEHYERALRVMEELGDARGIAEMLNNQGVVYKSQGLYGSAVEYYQKALRIAEEAADKAVVAVTLQNLGWAYAEQGSYGKANECYQRALRLAGELQDKSTVAQTLSHIGNVYRTQGLYPEAAEYYRRALDLAEGLGDKHGMARALKNIGVVYLSQGSYGQAVAYFQNALKISRDIHAKSISGYALKGIGRAHLKRQEYPQAVEALQQALTLAEEVHEPEIIWLAHYNLAGAYEKLNQPLLALEHYQAAIAEIEKVRAQASSDEEKAGFFQDKGYIYHRTCALLLMMHEREPLRGYDQQALAYAEQARARAFLDLLAEGLSGLNKRLSPELQAKEKNILARLSRANQRLPHPGPGPGREALVAEIRQLESEYDQLKEAIRRQDPVYASLVYPQPYTVSQMREQVLINDETALVEYLLAEGQSLVYLVSRQALVIRRLPGRARIEEKVRAFLDRLKSAPGAATARLQAASSELYQDLLAPIGDRLERYRYLIIAADGLLYYLPFEALGSAGPARFRYLIQDHVISYVPSATALGELRRRPRNRSQPATLLALGDPEFGENEAMASSRGASAAVVRGLYDMQFSLERLPFAKEEVQSIARYFPRREIRVQSYANEAFIKQAALENYRVIHFATHGLLDERNPQASCLVLARDEHGFEDGFLQVREIYDLKLNADLVVLSACNTGRGRLVHGEGTLGLNRAFFCAGARSVLGSLWSINDRASADFMSQFYYRLRKGQGKAEALRAVKLKFLQSPTHAHPYYWAAFILQGEPTEALFSGTPWGYWLCAGAAALMLGLGFRHWLSRRAAARDAPPT